MIEQEQFKQVLEATFKVKSIKADIRKEKKDSKENFNFFRALVTDKKLHLEVYHTNFIAYLLDPNQSHDCDDLFLKSFIQLIQKDCVYSSLEEVIVTVNKVTNKKRFIDIVIEYKNDWIIFIENKVRSYESLRQLQDYYDFCFSKLNKEPIGILLTQRGDKAASIDDSEKILSLSYTQIIKWLEDCVLHLSDKHNVTHSIKQYIIALKQILKISEDEVMEKFESYLDANFVQLPTMDTIEEFKTIIRKYACTHKEREIFYSEVTRKLNTDILFGTKSDNTIIFDIEDETYKIEVHSSNDGSDGGFGGWFGIYRNNGEYIKWEEIKIKGINDFKNVVEGTNKIRGLKNEYEETVKEVAENIGKTAIATIKNQKNTEVVN
jgi:hypothetical protein